MANLFEGLKQNYDNAIGGIQQIFQNAGYNEQQTGQSVASGLMPRALGGQGLVSPAYASETNTPVSSGGGGAGYEAPAPTNTNTGGGGSAPDISNPAKQTEYAQSQGYDNWAQMMESQGQNSLQQQQAEVDSIFNEVNSYLDKNAGLLQSSKDSLNSDVDSQLQTNLGILDTSRGQADRLLGEQGISAQQRNIDNQNASRRLFNELQTGGRQRFGGASSAGQAYTELNNVEQQRRAGQNAEEMNTAMREIDGEKMRVQEEYGNGLLQLNQQAQQAKNDTLREFNSQMMEINNSRASAAQNKGAMKLEALQNLRNQMFQIQVQERQFQQNLESARQQMLMELEAQQSQYSQSVNNAGAAYSGLANNTTLNPNTGLGINASGNVANPQMTGMINRDDEYPVGRVAYNNDPRLQGIFNQAYGTNAGDGTRVATPQMQQQGNLNVATGYDQYGNRVWN